MQTQYIRLLLSSIVLLAIVILSSCGSKITGNGIDPPKPMPDFTLQPADGSISLSDFRGKFVVLYFGYTFCPDACQLILGNLQLAMDKLGDKSKDVKFQRWDG